jgi:hypothetical protein
LFKPEQLQRSIMLTEQPSTSSLIERPKPEGSVLGVTVSVEKSARAVRPALVALLGAAIVLLGLASLPKVAMIDPRFNDLLARHRTEIAAFGAAALVTVAIFS